MSGIMSTQNGATSHHTDGGRDIGLDVTRVMASMMVVVIHVSASLFYRFEADWPAANFYDSLSRSAVPLFFMISGALLVPRDSDLSSIIRRAARMVVPLVFGSYVYLIWWTYNRVQPAPDLNPLSLLKGPVVFHLWFFYTLLGVYLFLPLLQGLYRKARSLHFFYLAMVLLAASIIPTLRDFGVSVPVGVDLQYFAQYAGYTFAGAVLAGILPTPTQTLLAGALGVVFSMCTALWTWHLSVSSGAPLETVFVYHAPLVALAGAAFFVAFRGIGSNFVNGMLARITIFVAQNAVGVFIFHIFFIDQVYAHGFAPDFINPWIGIPISSGMVWGASLLASAVIRALPYGKELLP